MFLKTCANMFLKTLKYTNEPQSPNQNFQQLPPQILSPDQFVYKFHQSSSIISLSIQDYKIINHSNFNKSYAVYIIRVTSEDLIFEKQKRYSQLYQLHQNLVEKYKLKIKFPHKTFIYSGTNQKIIKSRTLFLNSKCQSYLDFIQELLTYKGKNPFIYFQLIKFLNVQQVYQRVGIKLKPKQFKTLQKNKKKYLINELTLLNKVPDNSIKYAQNIERILLESKKEKLKNEEVKKIIIGNAQNKGLIQFCFQLQNQFSQIRIIQIINRILNPINNIKFQQRPQKYLLMLPNNVFKLRNQDCLNNQQFKNNYFTILQLIQNKNDFQLLQILTVKGCELYKQWKKLKQSHIYNQIYRNRKNISSVSPKLFNKIKRTKSQNKKQRLLCNNLFNKYLQYDKSQLKRIERIQKQDFTLVQQCSQNKEILRFSIQTIGNFQQYCQKLKQQSWNPLISDSKTDSLTYLLKQTIKIGKKQSKILIFQHQQIKNYDRKISSETTDQIEEPNQINNNLIVQYIKKPPLLQRQKSYYSYFQKSSIQTNQNKIIITITMYFHQENLRNYILSQIENKTNFMRDGIINQFFI